MDNPRRNADVISGTHFSLDICRRCYQRGLFQITAAGLPCHGILAVINDIQGHDAVLLSAVFYKQGNIYEILDGIRVGDRYEYLFFLFSAMMFGGNSGTVRNGESAAGPFGLYSADDAGDENHHYRAVEHIVIEKSLPVLHYDFMPDEHGGKSCGRLGIAEPENHLSLIGRHPVNLLGQPCRQPFAQSRSDSHHNSDLQSRPSRHETADIHNHSHSYQEIRYEKGVPDKFKSGHKGGDLRNQRVEHHAHKEGAEYSLHAGKRDETAAEEHKGKHKDELHYGVIILAEEQPPYLREHKYNHQGYQRDLQSELHPINRSGRAVEKSADKSKDDKGQSHRDGCPPYGNGDTPLPGQAVAAHNRICYERV